jgi:hypothetical protein
MAEVRAAPQPLLIALAAQVPMARTDLRIWVHCYGAFMRPVSTLIYSYPLVLQYRCAGPNVRSDLPERDARLMMRVFLTDIA